MIGNVYGQYILGIEWWRGEYFRGAPLIVFGDNLTSTTDTRWTTVDSVIGVTLQLNAPMIGVQTAESWESLDVVLRAYQRFFDSTCGIRPFAWCTGDEGFTGAVQREDLPLCGPIIACPTSTGNEGSVRSSAWEFAQRYARTTQQHCFGQALQATAGPMSGSGDTDLWTPPVYAPRFATFAADLKAIKEVWLRGGVATKEAIATLQALDATRPGTSRRVNPILQPWLYLPA